jgi:inner membrane protein
MKNPENQNENSIFQSTTAKMIMVGFLTLFLLIPLEYVKNLITERSILQKEVVTETSEKWGESIYFYGPILKVPYKDIAENKTKFAYFFPEQLSNTTTATMEKPLQRSLYKSNVFSSKMNFTGFYKQPNFNLNNISPENIAWNNATIIIKTTNLKSITSEIYMKLGNNKYTFRPNHNQQNDSIATLETGIIDINTIKNSSQFNLNITYNGSKQIQIVPIGKTTTATMNSNWNSPSFAGSFLPINKKITDNGFVANWKILDFNRSFEQQYFDYLPDLKKYSFATNFITPVDEYQQNERASKYGFLVIGLTFLIFFLIQSISKISIHIFQYSMIGLALIMFYTLLISITEHSSFKLAYGIAGISVVILITLYSVSILKNKKFPMFIGAALTALYTFIFVIIQLENYALLVGSIGLFLILAAVMYFSRKIDWSNN